MQKSIVVLEAISNDDRRIGLSPNSLKFDARTPVVWELDGPTPSLNRSNTPMRSFNGVNL
jgi:hypothetical protein